MKGPSRRPGRREFAEFRLSVLLVIGLLAAGTPAFGAAALPEGFRLVASDATGVTLEYEAPEPAFTDRDTPFGLFQAIDLPGHAPLLELGRPALPTLGVGLAIPEGAEPRMSFEVLESQDFPAVRPLPAFSGSSDDLERIARDGDAAIDRPFYEGTAPFPASTVVYEERGSLRHHRVASVLVQPMQYHPGRGVTFVRRARIRVDFHAPATLLPNGAGRRTADRLPVGKESAWEDTYERSLVNYEAARLFRSRPAPVALSPGVELNSAGAMAAPPENPEFRIYVGTTGAYYLTVADLQAAGWPAGVSTGEIRLYEKAMNAANPSNPTIREIPIRIEDSGGTPGVFDADDTIYFYGLNYADRFRPLPENARFTNLHVYWLSWRAAGGARMAETPGWNDAQTVTTPTSFAVKDLYEEDDHYFYFPRESSYLNPFPRAGTLYWLDPFASPESLAFATPDREATLPFRIRARWMGRFAGTHYINLFITRGTTPPVDFPLANFTFSQNNAHLYDSGLSIPGDRLADGVNRLKIIGKGAAGTPESNGSGAYFDWFEVTWYRKYVADQGRLRFTTGNATGDVEFAIRGLTTSTLPFVFDVTDSLAPTWVDLSAASLTQVSGPPNREFELRFRVTAPGQRTYLLLAPAAIPSATTAVRPGFLPPDVAAKNIVADAYVDAAEDNGADILVLVHPSYRAAIEPWVALRRDQGHTLKIVSPQDVWNQFSGGDKFVPAIRSWLRWTYRNWTTPPDHLVLFGDGSEDYRHDVGSSKPDWVPTMMLYATVPNSFQNFDLIGSDNWFVAALGPSDADTDLLPDMHVGRLPAGNGAEAEAMVAKLVAYDDRSPADDWRNRGLIVSDDLYSTPITAAGAYCYSPATDRVFEGGADSILAIMNGGTCVGGFQVEEIRLSTLLDPVPQLGRTLTPGNCPDQVAAQLYVRNNTRPLWLETSSRGHLVHFYSGHGNKFVLASEYLVEFNGAFSDPNNRTVEQLTNFGKPFVFVGLGCHLNEFEHYQEGDSEAAIAEKMVLLPGRGAIASIASTGYEVVDTNLRGEIYLWRSLVTDLPRDDQGRPRRILGEGFHQGFIRMGLELGSYYLGTLRSYVLLGDPSMEMDMAPPRLDVRVNGTQVLDGAILTPAPGASAVQIVALVSDDVDYGRVTIQNDSLAVPAAEIITQSIVTANGCRASRVTWNAPLKAASYPVTITAFDWVGRPMVFNLKVVLDVEYRVNGARITDGQPVPPDALIEAIVTSPVAIPEGDLEVRVNGEAGFFDFTPTDAEGRVWTGTVNRTLPTGPVELETRIDGVVARSAFARISVDVQGGLSFSDVYFYPNPWRKGEDGGFTYLLSFQSGEAPQAVAVTIYSVSGRKVVTLQGPAQVGRNWLPWDVKDGQGDSIANGVYLYKITVRGSDGRTLSHTDRLVISQ